MSDTLLPGFDAPVKHPAKYSPDLLRVMSRYLQRGWLVYDPFGGVGGLHRISSTTGAKTVCGEIEYRVIANAKGTRSIVANARALPFSNVFDAIATSPVYGNRMSDNAIRWTKASDYRTYSSVFGFELHPDNSGLLNWGDAYREFHVGAWNEAVRVLKPGGLFILNVSDHIRAGEVMPVSIWHLTTLAAMGLMLQKTHEVDTPRLTYGANRERVGFESIFVFLKG